MLARIRPALFAIVFSLLASSAILAVYLAPPEVATFANRIADYLFINQALRYVDNSAWLQKIGYRPVDLDTVNNNIVLIKMDEESVGNFKAGVPTWPFPRSFYEPLLKKLHAAGAKTVAFDIDFPDPSNDPAQDAAFARGLKTMPTVLPFTLNTTTSGQLGVEALDPAISRYTAAQGYTTTDNPGGMLVGQALTIDAPAVPAASGNAGLPAFHSVPFAGAAVENYTGKKISRTSGYEGTFGTTKVPLSGSGLLFLLPFNQLESQDINQRVGAAESDVTFIQSQSLFYVTQDSVADLKPFVNGKLVVMGATAQALGDFILTPFGRFPGVFANLRFMDQLLTGKFIRPAPAFVNIGLIFVLPLLLGIMCTLGKATRSIALCLVAIVVYVVVVVLVYSATLYWVDVIHVAGAMFLATMIVSIQRVTKEGSDRRMVTNLFGMHVSPAIVSDILSHEDPRNALALKGKKVKATIFYSDIRGFTAMSENMTPEEIYNQLNEYFEEMCAIIFQYGGYVDKFIGDCVMAVFSAPYQTPNDAKNAVLAAVAQQKKILELAQKWKAQGKREFTVGMGVNTGDVVMGNLGASSRMNYTVIGDNVNLAARLYNVAKAGEIIISDYTYQEVKDLVVAEDREPVMVKGKKDPISIYNITDVKADAPSTGAVTPQPVTA